MYKVEHGPVILNSLYRNYLVEAHKGLAINKDILFELNATRTRYERDSTDPTTLRVHCNKMPIFRISNQHRRQRI